MSPFSERRKYSQTKYTVVTTITAIKCSYPSHQRELINYNTKSIQVINRLTMMDNDDGDHSRQGMQKHIYIKET